MIKTRRFLTFALLSTILICIGLLSGKTFSAIQSSSTYERGIEYKHDIVYPNTVTSSANEYVHNGIAYSTVNLFPFCEFILTLDYDFENTDIKQMIIDDFETLYSQALSQGIIEEVANDFLLILFSGYYVPNDGIHNNNNIGISPAWSAGQTLDTENDGTHQVITKEALDSVMDMFPDFFSTNSSGIPYVQLYSDYPDVHEQGVENSRHYYSYETKLNLFGGTSAYIWGTPDNTTAKDMFYLHYNKAIEYYVTDRVLAFKELGAAIHYLSDIGAPPHVGNELKPSQQAAYFTLLALLINLGPGPALDHLKVRYRHREFEEFVNYNDESHEFRFPDFIDFNHYLSVDLDTMIEEVAANSYDNYQLSRGDESDSLRNRQMLYVATENTLPYIKEVVAGVLYRFAKENVGKSLSENGSFYLRNSESDLYIGSDSSELGGGIKLTEWNDAIESKKVESSNLLNQDYHQITSSTNGFRYLTIANNQDSMLQLESKNSQSSQKYNIVRDDGSGLYQIKTGSSGYSKALCPPKADGIIGNNIVHRQSQNTSEFRWSFDLFQNITISRNQFISKKDFFLNKNQWMYFRFFINPSDQGYYSFTIGSGDTANELELFNENYQLINSSVSKPSPGVNSLTELNSTLSSGWYHIRIKLANYRSSYVAFETRNYREILSPNMYGFAQKYVTEETLADIDVSNFSISTSRLRAGFISNEYLTLSPRQANAGNAYITYHFPFAVSAIEISLALWSSTELLRPSDCTATLDVKYNSGDWVTIIDLLNPSQIQLSTDKANPTVKELQFDSPVTDLRIYLTAPKIGTNNTGRLCIGDLKLYVDPDIEYAHDCEYHYAGYHLEGMGHMMACSICNHHQRFSHSYEPFLNDLRCSVCRYIWKDLRIIDPTVLIIPNQVKVVSGEFQHDSKELN